MAHKKKCPYCGSFHYRRGAFVKCANRHDTPTWKKLPKNRN